MPKSDLRIDILGTNLTISAEEEPEYLNTLLDKYRRTVENVQQKTGITDPLKTAVLTGFLLCDDLEKAGKTKAGQRAGEEPGEAEQLTLGMISRLNEIVPDKVTVTIYKLHNTVKYHDWGSTEWIPALLGQKNLSRIPWAELWMGVNPSGPSLAVLPGGAKKPLSELINQARENFLGKEIAQQYDTLPFLFKLLAAEKPLSIQAHPNHDQAKEGFDRENRKGIPLDAPDRNYRDDNHKPEIICALSPFAALCGFRKEREICTLIEILSRFCEGNLKTSFNRLLSALKDESPLETFLARLYDLENETLKEAGAYIKTGLALLEKDFPEYKDEWELCMYLSSIYPGDPGIFAPLFLNIIELLPGEAIYVPAGVLHAYIRGLGIELMADSDNVLRGGLTTKYVDVNELFRILEFSEYKPDIMKVPDPDPFYYSYPAPAGEFCLSVLHGKKDTAPYSEKGPSILLITEGSATVTESGKELILQTGESVFIPTGKNLAFSGTFTAYTATVPGDL